MPCTSGFCWLLHDLQIATALSLVRVIVRVHHSTSLITAQGCLSHRAHVHGDISPISTSYRLWTYPIWRDTYSTYQLYSVTAICVSEYSMLYSGDATGHVLSLNTTNWDQAQAWEASLIPDLFSYSWNSCCALLFNCCKQNFPKDTYHCHAH